MKRKKRKHKLLPERLILLEHFSYDIDTGILSDRITGEEVGYADKRGYRHVRFNKQTYKVHRIIYKLFHGVDPRNKVVDHIDGNPSNNCIDNLRCVRNRTNVRNNVTSRAKGVKVPKDINETTISKAPLRKVLKR